MKRAYTITHMRVILVHHADAVGPDVDPQRPLSTLGQQQAQAVAMQLKARGRAPSAIWHSGKLRARQTAEAILRACAPMAEFKMIRGLSPDDPPEWLRDELAAGERDVLLVGHMPHLPRLARLLNDEAVLRPHSFLEFDRMDDGRWRVVSE